VPKGWNLAELFILYKGKGPLDSGDSYRAISLTDIIGKLFERLIFARAMQWFSGHEVSKHPQFGFRPNCSTQDAVFALRGIINTHKVRFLLLFIVIDHSFTSCYNISITTVDDFTNPS
jgi:hypothetical protein